MGGKNSAPPAPDYSGLIGANKEAAKEAMKFAREQFSWAKQVYNENKGLMKATNTSFLKTMEAARIAGAEDRARYKAIYQPLESKMAADARTYDTPGRRDREVGEAQADVSQAFDAARNNAAQQLESFGVNPSATRFAALDIGLRAQEAASKAAAGTGAAKRVEETGRNLVANAANMGRGYPAQYQASQQVGVGAGGAAVSGTNQTFGTGAQAMGTGPQWMGAGNQALGNWGNNLNNQYENQISQYNANQQGSSGWGNIMGMVGGMALKRWGFDEGGAVPTEASPSGGAQEDDVPVAVSVGEFVVPRETVAWLGEKHFHKMIEKTAEERAETEARTQAVPTGPMAMAA